jgi:hypothetical protein
MKICFRCRKAVEIGRTVARAEACPHCDADLHCCLNCRFMDRFAHQQCREPQAEPVLQKDRANFCEYFVFKDSDAATYSGRSSASRERLEQLFKKKK